MGYKSAYTLQSLGKDVNLNSNVFQTELVNFESIRVVSRETYTRHSQHPSYKVAMHLVATLLAAATAVHAHCGLDPT
jgi:hypothetical protein